MSYTKVALCLLCVIVALFTAHYIYRPYAYLNKYNKPFEKDQLGAVKSETNVVIREFSNGEWVALIYEHDCCTGKGFVANVFTDSHGNTFTNTGHNYCNVKATEIELLEVKSSNLSEFYTNIGIPLAR
jgi:hypothetical protein